MRVKDKGKKPNARLNYPRNVLTAANVGTLTEHGISFKVRNEDCAFINNLDGMRAINKKLFGSGYLISDWAANEIDRAKENPYEHSWASIDELEEYTIDLSARERDEVRLLNEHKLPNG